MNSKNFLGYDENCDPIFVYEFVTFGELFDAYEDCKRQKMQSKNCIDFVIDAPRKLYKLWIDLNSFTYEIGPSICFITYDEVFNRKYREIFAADFIDRIIQHFVINRLHTIFDAIFIPYTFSCRKGKGTSGAINALKTEIAIHSNNFTEDCWIVQLDVKAFFPQIDKEKLKEVVFKKLNEFRAFSNLSDKDFEFTLYLVEMIIDYNPRIGCKFKQPQSLWENLPPHKSAFNLSNDKYLAVGNITSQFLANVFLSDLDNRLSENWTYLRYVDDMAIIIHNKSDLSKVIDMVSEELSKVNLKLSQNKIKITHYSKGIKFLGKVIKFDRLYVNKEVVGKAWMYVNFVNNFIHKNQLHKEYIPFAINKFNSYLGLMIDCTSFKLRKRLCLACMLTKYAYVTNDFSKLIIYEDFKLFKTKKVNLTIEQALTNSNKTIYKFSEKILR